MQLLRAEIADSEMASFPILDQASHGVPSVSILDGLSSKVAIFDGPVHVIQVQILDAQHTESSVDCFVDQVGIMAVTPSASKASVNREGRGDELTGRSITCS